jgi:hypothetical protein
MLQEGNQGSKEWRVKIPFRNANVFVPKRAMREKRCPKIWKFQ